MAYTPAQIRAVVALAARPRPLPIGMLDQAADDLGLEYFRVASMVRWVRNGQIPYSWERILGRPRKRRGPYRRREAA